MTTQIGQRRQRAKTSTTRPESRRPSLPSFICELRVQSRVSHSVTFCSQSLRTEAPIVVFPGFIVKDRQPSRACSPWSSRRSSGRPYVQARFAKPASINSKTFLCQNECQKRGQARAGEQGAERKLRERPNGHALKLSTNSWTFFQLAFSESTDCAEARPFRTRSDAIWRAAQLISDNIVRDSTASSAFAQPDMLAQTKAWCVAAILSSLLAPSSAQEAATTSFLLPGSYVQRNGNLYLCKCYPGDRCYPSSLDWKKLNTTVNGNLQVALPPAAPCYTSVDGISTSDPAKCAEVQANYPLQQWT